MTSWETDGGSPCIAFTLKIHKRLSLIINFRLRSAAAALWAMLDSTLGCHFVVSYLSYSYIPLMLGTEQGAPYTRQITCGVCIVGQRQLLKVVQRWHSRATDQRTCLSLNARAISHYMLRVFTFWRGFASVQAHFRCASAQLQRRLSV